MLKTSIEICEYLHTLYTNEGLFDPDIGSTLPNKYGNSFYALACTLLYRETNNIKWKSATRKAVVMELINTKNRFQKVDMFRWEFKNYALLRVLEEDILEKETKKKLVKYSVISRKRIKIKRDRKLAT